MTKRRIQKSRKTRIPLRKSTTRKRKYNKKTRGGNPDEIPFYNYIEKLHLFLKQINDKTDETDETDETDKTIVKFFQGYGYLIFTNDDINNTRFTLFEEIPETISAFGVNIHVPFQHHKLFYLMFYTDAHIEKIITNNSGWVVKQLITNFKLLIMNFFHELNIMGKDLINLFKKLQTIEIDLKTHPWAAKIQQVIQTPINGVPFVKLLATFSIKESLSDEDIKCEKTEIQVLNEKTGKPIGCASITAPKEDVIQPRITNILQKFKNIFTRKRHS